MFFQSNVQKGIETGTHAIICFLSLFAQTVSHPLDFASFYTVKLVFDLRYPMCVYILIG